MESETPKKCRTLREIMAAMFRKGEPGRNTVTGWDFSVDEPLIRSRAIRVKCIECQNGQRNEVANCEITDCPLWPYRRGYRCVEKGVGSSK